MVLRLSVRSSNQHEHQVTATLSPYDPAAALWTGTLLLHLSSSDREDFRWYWEQFADAPDNPAPQTAVRVETRLKTFGEHMFLGLFGPDSAFASIWRTVEPNLAQLRLEIETLSPGAAQIPWELIRIPGGEPLALLCREFVRHFHPGG